MAVSSRVTPLFAALLSIPTGDRYPSLDLSPQQQKDATVSALVNHFLGLAREMPLVIAFEDLHWIDPTSREVIDLLVDKVQNRPILAIITARSEFQPSWNAHSHITTLVLNRLCSAVAHDAGRARRRRELPEEVVEEIIVKTDGVPLFLEELTKTGSRIQPPDRAARTLRAVGPVAAARDPGDPDGLADGAAGPDGTCSSGSRRSAPPSAASSPTRRCTRSPDTPAEQIEARARSSGGGRADHAPRPSAGRALLLQARDDPERRA